MVPRLRAGIDYRTLPLDPTDGFVLTRVDGKTTIREISQTTGIAEFSVTSSVDKLKGLGVLEIVDANAPPAPAPAPSPGMAEALKVPSASSFHLPGREQRYTEEELREECDLELEHRRQILDLYYDLGDLDYYTLLGTTREADKKVIKRAYYDLAARLHPDRFFRKKLGKFKAKMEVVFARITIANDTLTDKVKRAEYDSYLGEITNTRSLEAQLARAAEEASRAAAQLEAQTRAAVAAEPPPPPPPPPAPPPSSPSNPELELRLRREALARRLGKPAAGSAKIAEPAPSSARILEPAPPSVPTPRTQENRDTLRRMYDERMLAARTSQTSKYMAMGRTSLAHGDPVAAANALKMALSFSPDDAQLRALHAEAERAAGLVLVESYIKTAQYEERNERWAEAARSWTRIAQLRPENATDADTAARCILLAQGNLHEAAALARHAITIAPASVKYRITLANVYLAAGLVLGAKRELESAARIEPKNPEVAELLRRLPKTG